MPHIPVTPVELAPGLSLSRIVWGAWRLAEAADHSPAAVAARIQACLDQGITTFDHADIYGDYRCETLFGDALRAQPGLKARLQIVTKTDIMLLSKAWPGTRVKHYDTTPQHVSASVDRSLQRLGVEAIDVLLIHRPDPLMDAQALGACLDGLIDAGKVRAAGVSNFMPWDVDLLQSAMRHRLVTNQVELHPLHLEPFTNGQLAHAQQHRMPVMAWSPLAGGRLFADEPAAARVRAVLERIARAASADLSAAALAWLLHHPARVLPVVGTTDPKRIGTISQALAVPMDRQTWFEIYEAGLGREVP
jgi:predicted oxidoreductase